MNGLSYWSAVLMVAVVVLASCSDDQTECSLEDHIALQTGNFWIYQTMDLDENGDPLEQTARFDTIVVEGTILRAGKLAYLLVTYGGQTHDTAYMAVDNGVVYRLDTCACVDDPWIRLADCNISIQTQTDKTQPFQARVQDPQTGKEQIVGLTSRFKVVYSDDTEENVSVLGQTFLSSVFRLVSINSITTNEEAGADDTASIIRIERHWLVRGIGIVRYRFEARKEQGDSLGFTVEVGPGFLRELTEYFVQ